SFVNFLSQFINGTTGLIVAVASLLAGSAALLKAIADLWGLWQARKDASSMKRRKRRYGHPLVLGAEAILLVIFGTIIFSARQTPPKSAPIRLPADLGAYFVPSGWMGDGELGTKHLQIDDVTTDVQGSRRI